MQKYCSNCGASVDQQSNYCNNCGEKISVFREIEHDEDSLGLKKQNVIVEEDVIQDDLINPDDYKETFIDENLKSKSINKSIIITTLIISVIFISLVILNNVTLPILSGNQTIYVDQYTEYKDKGLNFGSIHNPSVRVTGLPNTSEPGNYQVKYSFISILGFEADPIYRTVIVTEVEPLQRLYNLLSRVEEADKDNSNNISCNSFRQECIINSLNEIDIRVYIKFSSERDNIEILIYPYIGEYYDVGFPAQIFFKSGYLKISSCSTYSGSSESSPCDYLTYNYLYEYYDRQGIFARLNVDEVGPAIVTAMNIALGIIDINLDDIYSYYN
jgi:hypothetical protein